ncbi:MAG TPA: hypothetical protein VNE58_08260 [Casimicrobiaceae bacterium]|nr:hypothetical protein [Casimicrobiaceae bacterium]
MTAASVAPNVLLVGGLFYTLASVHLERPLLWSGVLLFAAYVVMALVALPFLWATIGLVVAAWLVLTGIVASRRKRDSGA